MTAYPVSYKKIKQNKAKVIKVIEKPGILTLCDKKFHSMEMAHKRLIRLGGY